MITIYNLTDVETPQLKAQGLVNQSIVVGRLNIPPGGSGVTADDPITRGHLAHYTRIGAASLNTRPPAYVVACARQQQQQRAAAARDRALAADKIGGR